MPVAYLPNVSSKNNSTAQIRRRANEVVSQVVQQGNDNQALSEAMQEKATSASPSFTGQVTQPALPVLNGTTIHTTANAGGATALPATPAGYTMLTINGVNYKVPLFAV